MLRVYLYMHLSMYIFIFTYLSISHLSICFLSYLCIFLGVEARRTPIRALLTDLLLLGHADALVFTFSSNFGQVAPRLKFSKCNNGIARLVEVV
jgi:hypothetical protein